MLRLARSPLMSLVPAAVQPVLARLGAAAMSSATPPRAALSAPLQLGDLTLRNRNIMASLTRSRSVPTSVPNDANVLYYTQRAQGGAGLILSEGTLVAQQGTEWPHAPGIWSEEHAAGWRKVTDSVHAAGGLIFCQLWHVGRVAHPDMPEQKKAGQPVWAPSAIAAQGGKFRDLPGAPGYVTPTALEDPQVIVEQFRHAAQLSKDAGFDGVEMHSANGYLIHQFLDSGANRRTDQWGGSIENRCRFGLAVFQALIDVWGPGRVGVKLSPGGGYNDVGMPLPETIPTFTHYISRLAALAPAYIQLVQYVPMMDQPVPGAQPPRKRGVPHDVLAVYGPLVKSPSAALADHSEAALRGAAVPPAAVQKRNPTPTRLFVNGNLDPASADALIEKGEVDAAVFGKLWIGNPDLQTRVEKGVEVSQALDIKRFYYIPGEDPHAGYTDYPTAS